MRTPKNASVKELIVRVQLGEQGAFEDVIKAFQDMAVGYGYAMLGDVQMAEDVAQEAFIHAYYKLPQLRDPAAFPGWFRRILFTQIHRQQRRETVTFVPLEPAAQNLATSLTPVDIAERAEMRSKVLTAIAALPAHQRTVVMLFYMNEYSQKEISAFLEIPTGTVKTRLHAARKRLKEQMLHTLQEYLSEHRPSNHEAFVKEMSMNLALGTVITAGTAGCRVRLIETEEVLDTRYSLQVQDRIKIRPEHLVIVDRQTNPARTLFRLLLAQVSEIRGTKLMVERLRDEGDRGSGPIAEATLAEGLELELKVGDDVYGHHIIFGRAVNGRPADPEQLLRLITPLVHETYEGDTFSLDPQSAAALTNRGNVHLDRGEYDQAIALYKQALAVDANYLVAHTNRGHAYEASGDPENAIADYKQVIALLEEQATASLPDNHPAWHQKNTAQPMQINLDVRRQKMEERLAALNAR